MTSLYNIGDSVRITAAFADFNGSSADPTTVVFKFKDPYGGISSQPATKQAVGVYYADLHLTSSGTWFYRCEGTGVLSAAFEGQLNVNRSVFYPPQN